MIADTRLGEIRIIRVGALRLAPAVSLNRCRRRWVNGLRWEERKRELLRSPHGSARRCWAKVRCCRFQGHSVSLGTCWRRGILLTPVARPSISSSRRSKNRQTIISRHCFEWRELIWLGRNCSTQGQDNATTIAEMGHRKNNWTGRTKLLEMQSAPFFLGQHTPAWLDSVSPIEYKRSKWFYSKVKWTSEAEVQKFR